MAARLGFAIATACSPDLLLVDEVLAVGDHAFRVRCMERIAELRASGAAIVLVSHDSELVRRSADRGMLLDAGRAVAVGSADRIVDEYLTAGQP
jgi:ABC-type polysaccharide/polyol phosphate transport system ATPase subunit